jgi:hypothetical protein
MPSSSDPPLSMFSASVQRADSGYGRPAEVQRADFQTNVRRPESGAPFTSAALGAESN